MAISTAPGTFGGFVKDVTSEIGYIFTKPDAVWDIEAGVAYAPGSPTTPVSGYPSGYDPTTGKVITKRRLEILREREALRKAWEKASAETAATEERRLITLREQRARAIEQRKTGALPTAEFYEKRLEEQYGKEGYSKELLVVSPKEKIVREVGVEPKLISPFQEFYAPEEKPKPSVKNFFAWLSEAQKKAAIEEAKVEKYELETPYPVLWERGQMPSIVRKGFYEAGEKYMGITSKFFRVDLTEEQKVRGGVIVGTLGMGFFFAPTMKTGATIQQELTKTRFTPLAKERATARLAKIEKKVAMKKTIKAQLKYLAKEKAKLKTPEERAGFERFFKEVLIEKEIIKVPTYRVGGPDITFAIERIPEMREVGAFVGGVPAVEKLMKKPKIKEEVEVKLKEPVILKEKVITMQRPREREAVISATITTPKLRTRQAIRVTPKLKVITKQIPVTRTIPKMKPRFPSPTISMKPTKPKKALPFLPLFPIRSRKLEPKKKIIRVRRIKPTAEYKPSLVAVVRKIKAPRIPKEYFIGMGPLIVRPIISPRRRRKKK